MGTVAGMKVPLTVDDFLERAELVYGDRIGVVDEPDQPARVAGASSPTARWPRARAGAGRRPRRARHRRRASGSRSCRHNSARLLTSFFGVSGYGRVLVPINFRLNADEVAYIVEHSGASVLLVDPELDDALARRRRASTGSCIGAEADDELLRFERRARAVGRPTRTRPRRSTTRAARRRARRACSSRTATSGSTRRRSAGRPASTTATCTCTRCRCSTATAGACRTRSPAWAASTSCCARSTAPRSCAASSEHGVTLLCGAPAVVAAILDAAATWDGPIPGAGRVRIVVAGAPPPTRTIERIETELGWEFIQIYGLTETSPLLTMNRSRAEYDDLVAGRARARKLGRAGAPALGVRAATSTTRARCWRASNVVLEGYWEQPEATADGDRRRLVPHRRRRRRSTTRATSRSPTARRT